MITNYKRNINKNYRIQINSALQTSKNYIQITKPNDDLSYTNSLKTDIHLEGFNLYKIDDKVLGAMGRIQRSDFLDDQYSRYAYKNVALPMISERHLIPEPFLTAMMVHLMGVHKEDSVLELGYGTNYEAAVLSELAERVYSIKQQNPLGKAYKKSKRDDSLDDYRNVRSTVADGVYGWKDKAPFDAIPVS